MFYEGDSRSDKEAGLLRYAKGLQSFQLWIQSKKSFHSYPNFLKGERDPMILQNLKENFNGAVDEYQKMKEIIEGKQSAPESGGYGGGSGKSGSGGSGTG